MKNQNYSFVIFFISTKEKGSYAHKRFSIFYLTLREMQFQNWFANLIFPSDDSPCSSVQGPRTVLEN